METNKRINNRAYKYCKWGINAPEVPKDVKKQMLEFMSICEDKNPKYKISVKKINQIDFKLYDKWSGF